MKKNIKLIALYFCIFTLLGMTTPASSETSTEIETILNWAENKFPDLFPSQQATQMADPWTFRFYPSTDIYIGENNGEMFGLGGGLWDEPTFLGSISDLFLQAQSSAVTTSSRIKRRLYDYDNNGANDAVQQISYDANGRVITTQYNYSGDGATDIINLFDDDAVQETGGFVYNSQGQLVLVTVDRDTGTAGVPMKLESTYEYNANGTFSRIDIRLLLGANTIAQHWIFEYTGIQLDRVKNFTTSTNDLINTTTYTYGINNLPSQSVFDSPVIDATANFQWRSDGKIESINTLSTIGNANANISYNAQALEQTRSFVQDGLASISDEILGENYTRTIIYDSSDRPITIQYDIDSDGTVDATVTLEWEEVACTPIFLWAPNAFPNFALGGSVNVPGTGVFESETCAP